MATPLDFAKALLNKLGIPQSQNRLVGLVAFAAEEGGHWANSARYNPFNTTLSMPGAQSMNGAGVKAYTSWEQGIDATARTMTQSNMRPMIDALKADASGQQFLASITQTPWCPQSSPGCSAYENANATVLYNGYAGKQDNTSLVASTSAVGWIKQHPVLVAAGILFAVGGVTYYFRPDLFRKIPVVGQLAAQENPVKALTGRRRRKSTASRAPGAGGGRVQTLLFPRAKFTPASATAWARSHGFKSGKVDVTDQYVRIRQLPPGGRMRTIQFQNTPVRAVVRFG